MIEFLLGLFTAISSVATLAGYAKQFAEGIVLWYVQNAKQETLISIADAAAYAARAKTQEDRFEAAKRWQEALSKPRVNQ